MVSFQHVVSASLARRFPPALAPEEDLVGLTICSLREVERGNSVLVMLCVDLTEQVLAEAVGQHAAFIITYSPMPSAPVRSLSTDDAHGRILLTCALHSLAVYSIHTACNSAQGGIDDWLARSVASGSVTPVEPSELFVDAGQGRLLEFELSAPLSSLVASLKKLLGLKHLRIALPAIVDEANLAKALDSCYVRTLAVQAGVPCAAVRECGANVLVASEMSHSHVLAANARGAVVILAGQSTIERAYLGHLRQELLVEFSDSDWNVKMKLSAVDSAPLAIV